MSSSPPGCIAVHRAFLVCLACYNTKKLLQVTGGVSFYMPYIFAFLAFRYNSTSSRLRRSLELVECGPILRSKIGPHSTNSSERRRREGSQHRGEVKDVL